MTKESIREAKHELTAKKSILKAIRAKGALTLDQIKAFVNAGESTINKALAMLLAEGKIKNRYEFYYI